MPSSSLSGGDFETQQPPYGPSPPPLAGASFPRSVFRLGTVAPKIFQGGTAKEANGRRVPGLRKACRRLHDARARARCARLHWHANAAEWAYVIDGQLPRHHHRSREPVRDRRFRPRRRLVFSARPRPFDQGIGPGVCTFVLVFDNGYFSEFGTFSISDWVGHTPAEVLAKNFGVPAATFADFPKNEVYIAQGPVPPALPDDPRPGRSTRRRSPTATTCSRRRRRLSRRQHAGRVRARVSDLHDHDRRAFRHQAGRHARAALAPECRRVAVLSQGQRAHDRVRLAWPRAHRRFRAGDVGYVPQGYGHYIENTGDSDLEIVLAFNNGSYQSISITAWFASTPDLLLATNFSVPHSTFADFPKGEEVMPD